MKKFLNKKGAYSPLGLLLLTIAIIITITYLLYYFGFFK